VSAFAVPAFIPVTFLWVALFDITTFSRQRTLRSTSPAFSRQGYVRSRYPTGYGFN